jgi:RNA polymerase sigma factor (sigma-70 family)
VPRVRELRPLGPGRRDLAARYWPLAVTLARSAGDRHPDAREDLLDAAAEALCRAAADFDEARGVPFACFARRRIRSAFSWAFRARGLRHARIPVAEAADVAALLCGRPGPAEAAEVAEAADRANAALATLPAVEADAVRLTVLEGRTLDEAADALGCCRSGCWGHRRRGLDRLRERIAPR